MSKSRERVTVSVQTSEGWVRVRKDEIDIPLHAAYIIAHRLYGKGATAWVMRLSSWSEDGGNEYECFVGRRSDKKSDETTGKNIRVWTRTNSN